MDLDAFLKEQPLDKQVNNYVEMEIREGGKVQQRNRKELVLVNSILISVVQAKQGLTKLLTEVNCSLQANENDRKCMQRAGQLLLQITKKSPHLINQSQSTLLQMVVLCCQKAFLAACGNVFIELLHHLITTASKQSQAIIIQLVQFLTSPKILPSTYRQSTRLSLYKLYLHTLFRFQQIVNCFKNAGKDFNRPNFIQRCINNGSGEKDPRNIGLVFELYLRILQVFKQQELVKYKTDIFQNLQSYYPIEFVGDQQNDEHKKINVKHITYLLDKCLTHPFFIQQTWDLLTTKTAAAPIAPFVPTFLLYVQKIRLLESKELAFKLKNTLLRLSQEQFIAQDYPQGAPDLGNLLIKILDAIFCRNDGSFNLSSFEIVMSWFEMMIGKIINGHCKHTGTMMGIFRSLVKNSSIERFKPLVQMFRIYALRSVINILNPQNQIVPKLGLAIVAMGSLQAVSQNLNEAIALLVLRVGKLYPEVSDQVKMLLLKILLQTYQSCPENRSMVRKVNDGYILKDCLERAKQAFLSQLDATQTYLVKAFIDFISVVYLNQINAILQNVIAANYQLQTYLLGRLTEGCNRQKSFAAESINQKLDKITNKFNFLISNLKQKSQNQGMVKSLKVINQQSCLFLIRNSLWFTKSQCPNLVFRLLLKLKQHLIKYQDIQKINYQAQTSINRGLVDAIFLNQQIKGQENSLFESLWRKLNNCQSSQTVVIPNFHQISSIQPQKFVISSQFIQVYPPTFVHWLWQNYNKIQDDSKKKTMTATLIQYLPQKLLLRDSKQVLQTAIQSEGQAASLLKVVRNLDQTTLKQTGIIQYSLGYLDQLSQNGENIVTSTEHSVCMMSILTNMLQKQKQGSQLKKSLAKRRKALKGLLQHKKRPIRQAVRKLLLILDQ